MPKLWRAAALGAALAGAALAPAGANARETGAAQLPAQEVALAQEIVRIGYPETMREAMFGGLVNQIVLQINQANEAQLASAPPEVRSFVLERQDQMVGELKQIMARHIPRFMEALALSYADVFTLDELTAIREFIATPAGQAYVQKSMELASNPHYAAATQPYMNEVMAEAQRWQTQMVQDLQERFGTGAE